MGSMQMALSKSLPSFAQGVKTPWIEDSLNHWKMSLPTGIRFSAKEINCPTTLASSAELGEAGAGPVTCEGDVLR